MIDDLSGDIVSRYGPSSAQYIYEGMMVPDNTYGLDQRVGWPFSEMCLSTSKTRYGHFRILSKIVKCKKALH